MKKIYKITRFVNMVLIIKYTLITVLACFITGTLILLAFKIVTTTGSSKETSLDLGTTNIDKLVIGALVLSLIIGNIYNLGKKIVIENGTLIYYNFFKEKYKIDIIKNEIYLEMEVRRARKSYYIERTIYFTENGNEESINCNWLSVKQCNDITVTIEKYKYGDVKNGEEYHIEKNFERFFIGASEMISRRTKKTRTILTMVISIIFAVALIMTFMIYERFSFYPFLGLLGVLMVSIGLPVFIFSLFFKRRIEKYTPEYIILKDTILSVDDMDFHGYDINKIEMTGRKVEFYNLFSDRTIMIYSNKKKYTFILGKFSGHLKKFLFSYEAEVYKDYDLLYESIMKWCFRNNIEFVRTGY